MKTRRVYFSVLLLAAAMAGCNGSTTTTSSTDSTANMRPGDSSVSVTTTTTVVHHRYAGTFVPQPNIKYIDLITKKRISVRVDTTRGVVNAETNEPVDLFVAPNSTDTFYGQTGTIANTHISTDTSGNYIVDTAVLFSQTEAAPAQAPATDTVGMDAKKVKEKNGKVKIKTADEKIKEQNGIIKEKDR